MKVFIRSFNPSIVAKTGTPMRPGSSRSGSEQWASFESLLKEALLELGCEWIEQPENPTVPDECGEAQFRMYAHKTKRDTPLGDAFYMQMHLRDLFTLDSEGWGADHSRAKAPPDIGAIPINEARRFCLSLSREMRASGVSKHRQPNRKWWNSFWSPYPRNYILVPLQVPRDYVAIHHSRITVLELIRVVSEWAAKKAQPIVFKLHPFNVKDADIRESVKRAAASSRYVRVADGNIQDLISRARGVWTINSGVGFESLIHGKPVVTFGNCDYKYVTFSASAENLDEAREYTYSYSEALRTRGYQFVSHYVHRHAYSIRKEAVADSRARLSGYLSERLKPITAGNI